MALAAKTNKTNKRTAPGKATKKKGKVISRTTPRRNRGAKKNTQVKAKKRTPSAGAGSSSRAKRGSVAHQSKFSRRNWAKRLVFKGKKVKTSTGLFKRDLMLNPRGAIVSKRKSMIGKQRYLDNHLDLWTQSFMQSRDEQGITGFVLCKRTGNARERSLFASTRAKWQDLKHSRQMASRMVTDMQRRPDIMGKVNKMLSSSSADAATANSKVKTEEGGGPPLVPGDQVRVQKGAANFEYRGQMGVVERFQLGRVVVNFHGTLKAVKLEDLTRV